MKIFEKRPLCLILCIGLVGFYLFTLDNPIIRFALLCIAILLGIISLILKICKKQALITLLASIAILVSMLLSYLYFDRYFKAYEIYDGEVQVFGCVEGVTESSSYNMRLTVRVESIDDKPARGYKLYAYATKAEVEGIIEGTRISFVALLTGFSDESYAYNISNGINAYASDLHDIEILEYTRGGISMRFSRMREYVTRYIMSISSYDAGAIISALLLGEREYLPDQLRLDFKRIGISHILALSGMHLAVLSMGIEKTLMLFSVKKKTRLIITAAFVAVYMALTGFSVSVVRAGLMLILSVVLFLLSRSKDSLTSLSVAVVIICIATPYAILDISLWLSALATFGIIAFGELTSTLKPPKDIKERLLRYISVGILASIFAISATMAVSAVTFGGFSLLAPITTIIFSLIAELIMYLGCIMLLIGWLVPIKWAVMPLCWIMTKLAGAFSEIRWAYVSSSFGFAMIMIFCYTAIFCLFLTLKLKNPFRVANILVILYAIVTITPTVATIVTGYDETVAYYSDYRSDELLIRSKNEVCLINSSQYSKNLAYTSLDLIEDAKVTYLDKYYITHYSWSIDDELEVLMYNVSVDKVYVPEPRNEDEETILKILKKCVEDCRTDIVVFREYETVKVGKYSINLLYSEPYGNTSMNAFSVAKGDELYTYISSGLLNSSEAESLLKYASLSDHLILGDHGKKYKDRIYFDGCYEELESLIIHSENVFLLQNNMMYYLDGGCDIRSHPDEIIYFK